LPRALYEPIRKCWHGFASGRPWHDRRCWSCCGALPDCIRSVRQPMNWSSIPDRA